MPPRQLMWSVGQDAVSGIRVTLRSTDPLHEQHVDLPLLLQDQIHHGSGAAEGERPHRPIRLLPSYGLPDQGATSSSVRASA